MKTKINLIDFLALLVAVGFCAFLIYGIGLSLLSLGFNLKLTFTVISILSIPSLIGLVMYLGNFIAKKIKVPARVNKITMEQYLYKQNHIEQIAYETSNFFRIAMKNKALTRPEILLFKEMLDNSLHEKVKMYSKIKFENDCHEIYTKLKSCQISKSDMEALKDYIMPFALAYIVPVGTQTQPSIYKHLKVVK